MRNGSDMARHRSLSFDLVRTEQASVVGVGHRVWVEQAEEDVVSVNGGGKERSRRVSRERDA